MNTHKLKTYRFTRQTIQEIDYLASRMLRSRNGVLVYLIHQAYQREQKRQAKTASPKSPSKLP